MVDEDDFARIEELYKDAERQLAAQYSQMEWIYLTVSREYKLARKKCFEPMFKLYATLTGVQLTGVSDRDLDKVRNHRIALCGPPCPECGKPLRSAKASQCFHCGADWH